MNNSVVRCPSTVVLADNNPAYSYGFQSPSTPNSSGGVDEPTRTRRQQREHGAAAAQGQQTQYPSEGKAGVEDDTLSYHSITLDDCPASPDRDIGDPWDFGASLLADLDSSYSWGDTLERQHFGPLKDLLSIGTHRGQGHNFMFEKVTTESVRVFIYDLFQTLLVSELYVKEDTPFEWSQAYRDDELAKNIEQYNQIAEGLPMKLCQLTYSFLLWLLHAHRRSNGKMTRISDDVCPLKVALSWRNDKCAKTFVLQENDTGDILFNFENDAYTYLQWDAFEIPELDNFLRILRMEEQQYQWQIRQRYSQYKYYVDEELRRRGYSGEDKASAPPLELAPEPPDKDYSEYGTGGSMVVSDVFRTIRSDMFVNHRATEEENKEPIYVNIDFLRERNMEQSTRL
uniref:SARAH domain-containing protein n=1 Tax=Heterorhabditis bacteriophora TaxID=37862 RepID=A0A1I7XRK9_HETBA